MLYLNSNEEVIIGAFIEKEEDYIGKTLELSWNNGSIVTAIYDSFIEDENGLDLDDEDYEEYWSFIFKVVNMVGKAPIEVSEDGFFSVNYHIFPQSILVKKVEKKEK